MVNLFVEDKDTFDITIYVGKDKNDDVFADVNKENLLKYDSVEDKSVESVTFTFRRPSYKDEVNLFKNVVSSDGMSIRFDPSIVRYERFKNLLVGWSLKTGEQDLPVTPSYIDKLHPRVAGAVLDALDSRIA